MRKNIKISKSLLNRFIEEVKLRYPLKSFGYFLSTSLNGDPTDFVLFKEDRRKEEHDRFVKLGKYYENHIDAGFVSTSEETWKIEKMLMEKNLYKVGLFHSHRRQPAIFSSVDKELHPSDKLWHLILSIRTLDMPQFRIFEINDDVVSEIVVEVIDEEKQIEESIEKWTKLKNIFDIDALYVDLKKALSLDKNGEHVIRNNKIIYKALLLSELFLPIEKQNELLNERYIKGLDERRKNFIQNNMVTFDSVEFNMGSDDKNKYTYIGEVTSRKVKLSSFCISKSLITQGEYSKFDSSYIIDDEDLPVVNVTWYDAYVFSKWVGLRLPTESEWEYSCRGNSSGLWCCEEEEELKNFGWYSENSNKKIEKINQLKPNKFDIYDMHGNVWEWCDTKFIENLEDSVADEGLLNQGDMMVCRGGSIFAFAEMCRNSFRYGEPPDLFAFDLGFRVAKDN